MDSLKSRTEELIRQALQEQLLGDTQYRCIYCLEVLVELGRVYGLHDPKIKDFWIHVHPHRGFESGYRVCVSDAGTEAHYTAKASRNIE